MTGGVSLLDGTYSSSLYVGEFNTSGDFVWSQIPSFTGSKDASIPENNLGFALDTYGETSVVENMWYFYGGSNSNESRTKYSQYHVQRNLEQMYLGYLKEGNNAVWRGIPVLISRRQLPAAGENGCENGGVMVVGEHGRATMVQFFCLVSMQTNTLCWSVRVPLCTGDLTAVLFGVCAGSLVR